jgi:biotin carboxyl carrier protein
MRYEVEVGGVVRQVEMHRDAGRLVVTIDGRRCLVDVARVDAHTVSLLIEDGARSLSREIAIDRDAGGLLQVRLGAAVIPVRVNGWRRRGRPDSAAVSGTGPQRIVAPMPGKVVRLLVEAGARVSARQPVIVIEAMKMENELRAGQGGVVADIAVRAGQSVDAGALLMLVTEGQTP